MDKDTPPTVASDAGGAEVDGAVAAPAECDSAGHADGAGVVAGDVSVPPSTSAGVGAGVGAGSGAGAGAAPLMRVSQPTPGSDTAAARAATSALAAEKGTGTTQEVLVSQDELERRFGLGETLYKRLDGQDLGKDGGAIESGSEAGQEAVLLALQELQTCSWLVRRLMVFSSNESLDDVNTNDMRFLFIEHYIGNLLNMVRSQDRRPLVSASRVNHQAFLTQLGNMKAVSDGETAIVSGEASSNSQDVRARKIERFKQKRALEQRSTVRFGLCVAPATCLTCCVQVLRRLQARLGDGEDGMLEEQQRELLKVQLDMAIMESVDAIVSLDEVRRLPTPCGVMPVVDTIRAVYLLPGDENAGVYGCARHSAI